MSPNDFLKRHLGQASPTPSQDISFYADNIVARFPYAPEGHTSRLEGPDAVAGFMRRIPSFAEEFAFGEPTIHETSDGFIAEYHGGSTFKSTGNRYEQDYISIFKIADGKIQSITEYYDPMRVLRAMGEV